MSIDYAARVDKGAALFEQFMPRGEWAWYISLDELSMGSPAHCVAAQLAPMLEPHMGSKEAVANSGPMRYTHAVDGIEKQLYGKPDNDPQWEVNHGLDLPFEGFIGEAAGFTKLQDAWIEKIKAIRAQYPQ